MKRKNSINRTCKRRYTKREMNYLKPFQKKESTRGLTLDGIKKISI